MHFTIPKNKHRAWPFSLGLFFNRKHFDKWVRFDSSCAYNLNSVDQYDINKLFGVGYFPSHHKNSARFGWNYCGVSGKIRISAYCYVNGERRKEHLCSIKLNEWTRCNLYVSDDNYYFSVIDGKTGDTINSARIPKGHAKKWQYPLGIFFGGNKVAPHKMKIEMISY